jgi:hypothetical protein
MGMLMLRCPMTDRNFSTGIKANDFRLIPDIRSVARCPYCRQNHTWRPNDAWLTQSIAPSERLENRVSSIIETRPLSWRFERSE